MSDFFIKLTPLPQPRPSGLDYTPEQPFTGNLDFSDLGDRIWVMPKVGTDLMMAQWNDFYNNFDATEAFVGLVEWVAVMVFLFGVGYLTMLAITAAYRALKKFL